MRIQGPAPVSEEKLGALPRSGPFCEPSSHGVASVAVHLVDTTSRFTCALGRGGGVGGETV